MDTIRRFRRPKYWRNIWRLVWSLTSLFREVATWFAKNTSSSVNVPTNLPDVDGSSHVTESGRFLYITGDGALQSRVLDHTYRLKRNPTQSLSSLTVMTCSVRINALSFGPILAALGHLRSKSGRRSRCMVVLTQREHQSKLSRSNVPVRNFRIYSALTRSSLINHRNISRST